jgi:hypothetical protein
MKDDAFEDNPYVPDVAREGGGSIVDYEDDDETDGSHSPAI